MIEFPKHKAGMFVSHNEHLNNYETVIEHLQHAAWSEGGSEAYDPEEWVSREDFYLACSTNEMWSCQWYPDTPIGFNVVYGSTFDKMLEATKK